MRKYLAADNGHKQSSERRVWVRECKGSDCGILLENNLVI